MNEAVHFGEVTQEKKEERERMKHGVEVPLGGTHNPTHYSLTETHSATHPLGQEGLIGVVDKPFCWCILCFICLVNMAFEGDEDNYNFSAFNSLVT